VVQSKQNPFVSSFEETLLPPTHSVLRLHRFYERLHLDISCRPWFEETDATEEIHKRQTGWLGVERLKDRNDNARAELGWMSRRVELRRAELGWVSRRVELRRQGGGLEISKIHLFHHYLSTRKSTICTLWADLFTDAFYFISLDCAASAVIIIIIPPSIRPSSSSVPVPWWSW